MLFDAPEAALAELEAVVRKRLLIREKRCIHIFDSEVFIPATATPADIAARTVFEYTYDVA